MKKQAIKITAILMAAVLILAACGSTAEPQPTESTAESASSEQEKKEPAETTPKTEESTETEDPEEKSEDAPEQADGERIKIGFSTYSKEMQRCIFDAKYLQEALEKRGYDIIVQYAEVKPDLQISQIENMIASGCKAIVCSPIDGATLSSAVSLAKENGVYFVAYAGLILNTPDLDAFVTDDLIKVGEQQGQYIVDHLGLTDGAEGPFNIEYIAGDPNDANARYYFNGAMSKIQPFVDEGKLIIKSGQTSFDACSTMLWDGIEAQQRLDNILAAYYADDQLDAVLCNNDSVCLGAISALKSAGYGTDKPMPITTGQDADLANVKSIIAEEQTMTVFKELVQCTDRCAQVVDDLINGRELTPDDTETYFNGSVNVPTFLCSTTVLDKDNYQQVVIDSGYYTKEELGLE